MDKSALLSDEIGDSGVRIFNGQISGEEYNNDLMGKRGLLIWEQMRKNDATVKASLQVIKLPIKSAEYRIDAADNEEPVNVEAAELAKVCLFDIIDWKKVLGEALTAQEFGFSIFEMVFEPRYINGKLRVALVKLGFRKQLSIYSWEQQDHTPGITQILTNGSYVSIPLERIVHIANEQEGENYQGVSRLRTAYKHWKIKDKLYIIDAVGAENQALGVADITVPNGASQKDKDAMEAWAKRRRANEISYIMKPEGFTVEMMDMKSGTLKDIKPSIDHHDLQILRNVLAQFIGLQSGSRALSEDHSRLFILGVKEVADTIVYAIQNTAIKTLIDLNFNVTEYPQLRVGDIDDENIEKVTNGIKVAVDAGILHPRSADENVVRKMLSLPEVAIEELDAAFEEDASNETDTTATSTNQEAETPEPADSGAKATVDELRALRASIEKALYDGTDQAA